MYHGKPHVCKGCDSRFSTRQDLKRHHRSKHQAVPTEGYRCKADGCSRGDKLWPRRDNFMRHLRTKHPDMASKYSTPAPGFDE